MSDTNEDLRAKVLIAEDDAIVALDLQGMLMRLGYDVVQIVDGAKTAIVSALRFCPDIVLIDLGLPGEPDAVDLAREINAKLDIPIVFCVGTPDIASLARTKDLEYATYLLKPINPDSLSNTLDTVLYKYKLERRVRQAEEKFRQLSDTCSLLRFFLDDGAAGEWSWSPTAGFSVAKDGPAASIRDRLAEGISRAAGETCPERVSFLLPGTDGGWAVIGGKDRDGNGLHGLAIPIRLLQE